jgi:hypothetical protein
MRIRRELKNRLYPEAVAPANPYRNDTPGIRLTQAPVLCSTIVLTRYYRLYIICKPV